MDDEPVEFEPDFPDYPGSVEATQAAPQGAIAPSPATRNAPPRQNPTVALAVLVGVGGLVAGVLLANMMRDR